MFSDEKLCHETFTTATKLMDFCNSNSFDGLSDSIVSIQNVEGVWHLWYVK